MRANGNTPHSCSDLCSGERKAEGNSFEGKGVTKLSRGKKYILRGEMKMEGKTLIGSANGQ